MLICDLFSLTSFRSKVFCTVKEGEVPPVPENRFLMRANPKDAEKQKEKGERESEALRNRSRSRSRGRDRDRRDRDRDKDRRRSGGRYDRRESPPFARSSRIANDGKRIKGRGRVVNIV